MSNQDSDAKMLPLADRLIQKAEVYEKHVRLGHLRCVDGNQIAKDLRDLADRIRHGESK